ASALPAAAKPRRSAALPYEALDIVGAEADGGIMLPAGIDPREDVRIPRGPPVGIAVNQRTGIVEERDRLLLAVHEGVHVTRWLEHIGAGHRHPIMLQIAPAPLDDEAVHGRGMPVAGDDARPPELRQMYPVTLGSVET